MPSFDVEPLNKSKEFPLNSKKIIINDKSIYTPKKIIYSSSKKYSEGMLIKDKHRGISESFKKITKDKLISMGLNSHIERKFINDLINGIEKTESYKDIHYFLIRFDSRTSKERKNQERSSSIPETKEIEYLFDILNHGYNDVIIPPIMPYLTGSQYITFLDEFYQTYPSYNSRIIGGLISSGLSRDEQADIIKYYMKKDVDVINYDLYGKSPDRDYPSINMLMRELDNKQKRDSKLLLASNVRFGRPRKTTYSAPAKDLLSFYAGFDAFARAHVMKISPNLPPNPEPSISRTFLMNDYGYITKDIKYDDIRRSLSIPFISDADLSALKMNYKNDIIKSFNTYNHNVEASNLQEKLSEGKKISDYLKNKSSMPEKYWKELLNPVKMHDSSKFFF